MQQTDETPKDPERLRGGGYEKNGYKTELTQFASI